MVNRTLIPNGGEDILPGEPIPYLTPMDLWYTKSLTHYAGPHVPPCSFADNIPVPEAVCYLGEWNWDGDIDDGWHPCETNDSLHRVNMRCWPVYNLYTNTLFFDYGGVGNETENGWDDTYQLGNDYVRPGNQYPPAIYVHFKWLSECSGRLGIQYWLFYPYNDGWNDHEGDWEHITVILNEYNPESVNNVPENLQIYKCDYYNHENVIMDLAPYQLYLLEDTHPVVFVGGGIRQLGKNKYEKTSRGEVTGASWPWPGEWDNYVSGLRVSQESVHPGTMVHYDDIALEVIPHFLPHEGSQGAEMDEWFLAHPEMQWAKANVLSGYYYKELSPAYKSTWIERLPDGIDEYLSYSEPQVPWSILVVACRDTDRNPIWTQVELVGAGELPPGLLPVYIELETPQYIDLHDYAPRCWYFEAQDLIVSEGRVYSFVRWESPVGNSESTVSEFICDSQNTLSEKVYEAYAIYKEICLDEVVVVGPGILAGPEDIYSNGNICISDIQIGEGGDISLFAGRCVEMQEGFSAPAGTRFVAAIDDFCAQYSGVKQNKQKEKYQSINSGKASSMSSVEKISTADTESIEVYPNPFNAQLSFRICLEQPGNVAIKVFDVRGRVVRNLVDEDADTGTHEYEWNGRMDSGDAAPSGIYFYSFKTETDIKIGKVIMIK